MEINGKKLIDIICNRLKIKGVLSYDSNIVSEISKLTTGELNQIVSFGNVQKWHNEEINKNNNL